jgi:MFS family permease
MLGYVYGDQCQFTNPNQNQTQTQCPQQSDPGVILNPAYLTLNRSQDLGVKIAAPIGILIGQLCFGWLADVVGRKKMCRSILGRTCSSLVRLLIDFPPITDGLELTIIIVATFAQAISANGKAIHIIGVLIIWRFIVSPLFDL